MLRAARGGGGGGGDPQRGYTVPEKYSDSVMRIVTVQILVKYFKYNDFYGNICFVLFLYERIMFISREFIGGQGENLPGIFSPPAVNNYLNRDATPACRKGRGRGTGGERKMRIRN